MMLQTMLHSISRRSTLSVAIAAGLLMSASAVQAQTVTYTSTLLGTSNSGATGNIISGDETYLTGINDSGALIGDIFTAPKGSGRSAPSTTTRSGVVLSDGTNYGFGLSALSSSGTITWAHPTSGNNANTGGLGNFNLTGVNSSGQVVGFETYGAGGAVSFIASSANIPATDAVTSGAVVGLTQVSDTTNPTQLTATVANGINDNGLVVGYDAYANLPLPIGVIYNSSSSTVDGIAAGAYVDVNVQSSTSGETIFNAVNNAGIAVGSETSGVAGSNSEGLIYNITTGTVLDEFSVAGSTNTVVTGINLGATGSQEEIVGYWTNSSGQNFGFSAIWNGSSLTFLNSSINGSGNSGDNTWLTGVNDSGVITGYSGNSGVLTGFVSTPNASAVPLPGAFWLMASTLAGFGGFRLRRKA